MSGRRVLLFIGVAAAILAACGRTVGSAAGVTPSVPPTPSPAPTATATATATASASPSVTPQAPGIHVHTGPSGVETILGVRVLELTATVMRGQWNQEQVLVRCGPDTRFAEIGADSQVHFSSGLNFATAGIIPGDRLNLAVDWDDRSSDGAYLLILATKL